MCRLLGYLGPPRDLHALLWEPAHALEVQSYAPRHQQHGLVNADGWGVGWYEAGRPEPARYRTARPMWSDTSFLGMARHLRAGMVVASVRSATPPAPAEESGVAPFVDGRHLFTHNGAVDGFAGTVGTMLRRGLTPEREAGLEGRADSEVLFAMVLDQLDKGAELAEALVAMIDDVRAVTPARCNVVASDGAAIVATRCGDTLVVREHDGARLVASEPIDDDAGWREVSDETAVTLTDSGITELPFDALRRKDH